MSESPNRHPPVGAPSPPAPAREIAPWLENGRPDRLKGIIGSPLPRPLIVLVESPQKLNCLQDWRCPMEAMALGGPSHDIPALGSPPWHGLLAWLVGYTATSSLGFPAPQTTKGKFRDRRSGQRREWLRSGHERQWACEWQVYRGKLGMQGVLRFPRLNPSVE
jgi:hypothetical protein